MPKAFSDDLNLQGGRTPVEYEEIQRGKGLKFGTTDTQIKKADYTDKQKPTASSLASITPPASPYLKGRDRQRDIDLKLEELKKKAKARNQE